MNDTWTFEDAVVTIGNKRPFYGCEVEINREVEPGMFSHSKEYSGEIEFSEPVSKEMFLNGSSAPVQFDIEIDAGNRTGELEDAIIFNADEEKNKFEFVAVDGEVEVECVEAVEDINQHAVNLLDDLACEIVDGNAHVYRADVENGFGPNSESFLKVIYDD